MTRKPRNRELDNISDRAYRAAEIIPAIYAHLNEQRSNLTLISAAGGSGVAGGNVANPTLRLVYELDGIAYREQGIKDAIATIGLSFKVLDEAITRARLHHVGNEHDDRDGNDDQISDAPQCIVTNTIDEAFGITARCDRPVDHSIRDDGTIGWHESGLCSMHRQDALETQRRRVESEARRMRRHREMA